MRLENADAETKDLVNAIVTQVVDAERVRPRDVAATMGRTYDRQFKIAWSHANARLHANGLGFAPVRGEDGLYHRATTQQKVARAQRFRVAASRKIARQALSVAAADPGELPPEDRDGFKRSQERNMMMSSRAVADLAGRKDPTPLADSNIPRLPRGR